MKTVLIILSLAFSSLAFAAPLKADKSKGQVVFEAVGKPSFLKIKGQGEGPEGEVSVADKVTGSFKFKMATLDTGIGLRNDHMKINI